MGERDIDDDGGVDDEEGEDTCQVTISISLSCSPFSLKESGSMRPAACSSF